MAKPQPSATPVVALHSLFLDGGMFNDLRQRSGRCIFAPDHRGQGSRRGERHAPTINVLADDAVTLILNIGRPVHIVGSSMGAYIAIMASARVPRLVRSCVLSAATADAELRPETFAELVADLRQLDAPQRTDRISKIMFGEVFLHTESAALGHWRKHFAALDTSIADIAHEVFNRQELWTELMSIRSPLLLLAGKLDHAKSPSDMQRIADRIGCAQPVIFEYSGHTPFVEQPVEVAETLERFWNITESERNFENA